MVTICSAEALHPGSVSTLGEVIFNAALAVRDILDQVDEQRF
ncbi:hypothetical protein [Rhodanobacter geophilus]|uniref:Uncharacterized protein n=1 Tax=Rhodanobacter geophilus TaxID=3162488 RepID=A0ABV3QLS5_9GAMM